ncbi:hypothetical protein [Catenulispora subtropica]|uniref:Uncharacterized protein n=1 Tax=Catenulispora subtropica TaxID=450798 RepID=A0ABN2R5Q7_9ACTN
MPVREAGRPPRLADLPADIGELVVCASPTDDVAAGIGRARLGFGDLRGVAVGGGSDADDEHVLVAELPRRTAPLAALVAELLDEE